MIRYRLPLGKQNDSGPVIMAKMSTVICIHMQLIANHHFILFKVHIIPRKKF